jgi:hypothetical protein
VASKPKSPILQRLDEIIAESRRGGRRVRYDWTPEDAARARADRKGWTERDRQKQRERLAHKRANPPPADDARHGSPAGYAAGCREECCRAAVRKATAEQRAAKTGLPPGDPRHGTLNGYANWKCGCLACTEAMTAAKWSKRNPGADREAELARRAADAEARLKKARSRTARP